MKKLLSAFLVFTLLFSPIGTIIFQDQPTIVDAKKYSSGKRSYSPTTPARHNNQSNYQNKQQQNSNITTNKPTTTKNKGGFFSGGSFMKGLMLGGLAGLLFGGLLSNMGFFGSLLGLFINVLAIVVLIVIIRKVFHLLTKKKKEDPNPWRN